MNVLGKFSHSILLMNVTEDVLIPPCITLSNNVQLYLLEFAETHIPWVGDAIQPSHPLLPSSPPALNLCQHQGHF